MRVVRKNDESNYTDAELIELLRNSHKGVMDIIYYKHMDSAIRFMRKKYDDEYVIMNVYQDSMEAVYKNALDPVFKLDTDFQGYINRICRNLLLNAIKKEQKQDSIKSGDFLLKKQKKNTGEFEEFNDVNRSSRPNTNRGQIEEAEEGCLNIDNINLFNLVFNKMKEIGTNCFEIINRAFLMGENDNLIAEELGYANARTVINLKSRCIKKLKIDALKLKIHS